MNYIFRFFITLGTVFSLVGESFLIPVQAQISAVDIQSSSMTAVFNGIKIYPQEPFRFDFMMSDLSLRGAEGSEAIQGKINFDEIASLPSAPRNDTEILKLVKYFMASLTVPEGDLWVNLSPVEPDRIVPRALGQTEMGRDLLSQDYMLKQLTASLMSPEGEAGKKFWERVYERLYATVETQDFASLQNDGHVMQSAIESFNKVWIVPNDVEVYQNGDVAYITKATLKVMLESDYVAQQQSELPSPDVIPAKAGIHFNNDNVSRRPTEVPDMRGVKARDDSLVKTIIKDTILPLIEDEVNNGASFANLRQIFHSMILAKWYEQHFKNSILGQSYIDRNITEGIELPVIARSPKDDETISEKDGIASQKTLAMTERNHEPRTPHNASVQDIYNQYLAAFKSGAADIIKEDYDPVTQTVIPRKYFTGGFNGQIFIGDAAMMARLPEDISHAQSSRVSVIFESSALQERPMMEKDNLKFQDPREFIALLINMPEYFNFSIYESYRESLKGLRLGVTDSAGRINLNIKENYPLQWSLVGREEAGWEVFIDDIDFQKSHVNISLRLLKDGREEFRNFQIGPFRRQLQSRKPQRDPSIDINLIDDRMGLYLIRNLMGESFENSVKAYQDHLDDFVGLNLGVTNSSGEISFSLMKNIVFSWNILGVAQSGWSAKIDNVHFKGGYVSLEVRLSKTGEADVMKQFQIGPYQRHISSHKLRDGEKSKIFNALSDQMGLIALKDFILMKDGVFNRYPFEASQLKGLRLGRTNALGVVNLTLDKNFVWQWRPLGKEEEGWDVYIEDIEFYPRWMRMSVRMIKGEVNVMRSFQIGLLTTRIRGAREDKDKWKEIYPAVERLGEKIIELLVTRPVDYDFRTFPFKAQDLVGLSLGKTTYAGDVDLWVREHSFFRWHILGVAQQGWEAFIEKILFRKTEVILDIRLRKPGEEDVLRHFQVGTVRKSLGRGTPEEGFYLIRDADREYKSIINWLGQIKNNKGKKFFSPNEMAGIAGNKYMTVVEKQKLVGFLLARGDFSPGQIRTVFFHSCSYEEKMGYIQKLINKNMFNGAQIAAIMFGGGSYEDQEKKIDRLIALHIFNGSQIRNIMRSGHDWEEIISLIRLMADTDIFSGTEMSKIIRNGRTMEEKQKLIHFFSRSFKFLNSSTILAIIESNLSFEKIQSELEDLVNMGLATDEIMDNKVFDRYFLKKVYLNKEHLKQIIEIFQELRLRVTAAISWSSDSDKIRSVFKEWMSGGVERWSSRARACMKFLMRTGLLDADYMVDLGKIFLSPEEVIRFQKYIEKKNKEDWNLLAVTGLNQKNEFSHRYLNNVTLEKVDRDIKRLRLSWDKEIRARVKTFLAKTLEEEYLKAAKIDDEAAAFIYEIHLREYDWFREDAGLENFIHLYGAKFFYRDRRMALERMHPRMQSIYRAILRYEQEQVSVSDQNRKLKRRGFTLDEIEKVRLFGAGIAKNVSLDKPIGVDGKGSLGDADFLNQDNAFNPIDGLFNDLEPESDNFEGDFESVNGPDDEFADFYREQIGEDEAMLGVSDVGGIDLDRMNMKTSGEVVSLNVGVGSDMIQPIHMLTPRIIQVDPVLIQQFMGLDKNDEDSDTAVMGKNSSPVIKESH